MRLGVRFLRVHDKGGFSGGPKIVARFPTGGWRSRSPFGDLGDGATAAGAVSYIRTVECLNMEWKAAIRK